MAVGKTVSKKSKPRPKKLTVDLELARFKEIQEFQVWSFINLKPPKFSKIKDSPLLRNKKFLKLSDQLLQLGFARSQNMRVVVFGVEYYQTVMTEAKRDLDAVFTFGLGGKGSLHLSIGAFHPNGSVTCVANATAISDPNFPSPLTTYFDLPGKDPDHLISTLLQKLKGRKRVSISVADCFKRHADFHKRDFKATKQLAAATIEQNQLETIDGFVPRFEKNKIYFHAYDTEKRKFRFDSVSIKNDHLRMLESKSNASSANQLAKKVLMAAELCVFKHLEFVGAPRDEEFLNVGNEFGIKLFEKLSNKNFGKKELFWGVPTLIYLWTMLGLQNRWDDARQIANNLKATFAPDSHWPGSKGTPKSLTLLLRMIAKEWSQNPEQSKPAKVLRNNLKRTKCQRALGCVDVWDAIQAKDQKLFLKALKDSIKSSIRQKQNHHKSRFILPGREVLHWACWIESFLVMFAVAHGLREPRLSAKQKDWLLVPRE